MSGPRRNDYPPRDDRPGGETFRFWEAEWDVDEAIRLTSNREPVAVPVAYFAKLLPFIRVDGKHAAGVDLARPLLLIDVRPVLFELEADEAAATLPANQPMWLCIDGWHRIFRAIEEGVANLPGKFLTPDEERHVRLAPMPRQRRERTRRDVHA